MLRIEDTDRARSTPEAVRAILDSLRWLGLDWDEGPEVGGPRGPYFQTERLALYAEHAERLIKSGHAYRCYATKEEIGAAREAYEASGKKGFRFHSPWRERDDGDPSEPHVVRFRAPNRGKTRWDDLIKGTIEVRHDTLSDFILIRSDKTPLYNFGCVVDDVSMGINLVARGDDHMINTTPQLLLYEALGAEPPQFAHMPMILDPRGQKLSKRNSAKLAGTKEYVPIGVLEYRDAGYVPDGVINYLARLGWSHGDQELFAREELIEKFDWSQVGATAARFDRKKFEHVQGHHLRLLPDAVLVQRVAPFLEARGLDVNPQAYAAAVPHVKLRATTLGELADGLDYFVRDSVTYEEKAARKFLTTERSKTLSDLVEVVGAVEPFVAPSLENVVNRWLDAEGLTMKQVAQPARVALSGRSRSPGLFDVMELLGRERTLDRLRRGSEFAARQQNN